MFFCTVSHFDLNNPKLRLNIGSPDADVSSCIINLATLARNQNYRAERFWRQRVGKKNCSLCFVFRVVLFYTGSVTQAFTDHLFGSSWVYIHCLSFLTFVTHFFDHLIEINTQINSSKLALIMSFLWLLFIAITCCNFKRFTSV